MRECAFSLMPQSGSQEKSILYCRGWKQNHIKVLALCPGDAHLSRLLAVGPVGVLRLALSGTAPSSVPVFVGFFSPKDTLNQYDHYLVTITFSSQNLNYATPCTYTLTTPNSASSACSLGVVTAPLGQH